MKFFSTLFFLVFSLKLFGSEGIIIEGPVIRLTPPKAPVTAIYLKMTNHHNKNISLIDVKSDLAEKFELHNMEMNAGKMVMRKVESILIKPHSTTELKSGGLHIMVFKMKKDLKAGDIHKLTLIFDDQTSLTTSAKVEKL